MLEIPLVSKIEKDSDGHYIIKIPSDLPFLDFFLEMNAILVNLSDDGGKMHDPEQVKATAAMLKDYYKKTNESLNAPILISPNLQSDNNAGLEQSDKGADQVQETATKKTMKAKNTGAKKTTKKKSTKKTTKSKDNEKETITKDTSKKNKESNVFQLKAQLKHSSPPAWIRFLIPASSTFHDLHESIQSMIGWFDDYSHEFQTNKYYIFDKEVDYHLIDAYEQIWGSEINDELKNEREILLNEIFCTEKDNVKYIYDVSRWFELNITLEKILPPDPENPNKKYPFLVKKKGTFPSEYDLDDDDDFDDDDEF